MFIQGEIVQTSLPPPPPPAYVQQFLTPSVAPTTRPTPTPVSPPVLESMLDVRDSVHVTMIVSV